jgi:hypothetical protein
MKTTQQKMQLTEPMKQAPKSKAKVAMQVRKYVSYSSQTSDVWQMILIFPM